MFSIRKSMLMLIGAGLLGGCTFQMQPKPLSDGNLSSTPIATDSAMEKRQWDTTEADYGNDAVFAHPFYAPLQPTSLNYRWRLNAFTEPWLFLGNDLYLPVGLFIQFPWTFQVNKSISAPPSYSLMPVLPDGAEPVPVY
jgi:hypothetical protein